MDIQERNRQIYAQRKAKLEAEFVPQYTPENMPPVDVRVAEALESLAFHISRIGGKLDRLSAAAERLAGSQPDPRPFSQIKADREASRPR